MVTNGGMQMPILRPYQQDILNRIRNSYATGHKSPTLVLGCGGRQIMY